jgi:ketosteroid isomerase-like protein
MTSGEFDSEIEKEIAQARNEYFTAIENGDVEKLRDILADDFVFRRNPFGGERSKEEVLAANKLAPSKIRSDGSDNVRINVFGEMAVFTGIQKVKIENATEKAKDEKHSVAITNVFVKRDGKWLLLLEHFVDLPPY